MAAKPIKLLLTDNVDNLGIVGDVVNVRPGYARNFLLPRGLGTKPTAGNIQRLAARRAQVEQELKERRAKLEEMFEKLKGHEITIMRSANEQGILFGGVSQHEITQALREEGFEVEERMVRIGAQIKRLDSYTIPLVLASDLRTDLKLWVVSDKPREDLDEAGKAAQAAPAGESQAHAGDGAAEDQEKPRSRRKVKAEQAKGDADEAQAADTSAKAPTADAAEGAEAKSKGRKKAKTAELA